MNDQLQFDDEAISITLRRAWDRALRSLAARVNKPTFETHIRAIKPLGMNDETIDGRMHCNVILGMPSAFTREWVEKRHATLITQVLEEILDCDVRLKFQLTPRGEAETIPARHGASSAPQPARAAASNPSAQSQPPAAFGDLFGDELAPQPELAAVGAMAAAVSQVPSAFAETLSPSRMQMSPPPASVSPARVPSARPNTRIGSGNDKTSTRPVSAASGALSNEKSSGRWEASDNSALNAKYTFDTFVVGQSNRLAQAGAQAVAQAPGAVYNPLFLYGPSGLGKTHLMHAIGNEIAKNQGGGSPARVAFVSGESFTTHFIASLRTGKAEDFRRKWRSVDLWLVDDIQFIAGKESTKEEFFHTFNALYQMGKQIVISSDRSPRELRTMDERLRSRFECGLIADIAAPDLETRLAILHKKAETEQARIPDDVLLYMAQLVQSNIRTLEGALVKLIAYASLVNSPVTTQLASSVLERYYIAAGIGDAHARAAQGTEGASEIDSPLASMAASFAQFGGNGAVITPELVQQVVAKHFNISTKDLAGKKRDKDTANARHIAIHLIRELTELSLLDIGKAFGGRDHATVKHSVDRIKGQIEADEATQRMMNELSLQLRAQASA